MEPTVHLSQEQIEFYHENGFLAIDFLAPAEEVEWMRGIYDRLFASRAGREVGDQFDLGGTDEEGKEAVLPQILGPVKYAPELAEGQFRVNAAHVVKQLLGDGAQMGGDHAILKPPKNGVPTPWHQDEAYWDEATLHNAVSIWMPLQEATIENGCMWFLPGTHRLPVQVHQPLGNDPRVHALELLEEVDMAKAVACPIPAGGCTIHHCRTYHYTGPNLSEQPRRAFIMGGGVAGVKLDPPRDFFWNKIKQTARDERARSGKA
ncbi:MAG TPA: phytanoyl-CoA dioxygenase family protein [Fimbriimonadaceae bacterium]|nr:phytanoyl-CoA dioxygenase family protein [Fimbriimonadaceae bacterium]